MDTVAASCVSRAHFCKLLNLSNSTRIVSHYPFCQNCLCRQVRTPTCATTTTSNPEPISLPIPRLPGTRSSLILHTLLAVRRQDYIGPCPPLESLSTTRFYWPWCSDDTQEGLILEKTTAPTSAVEAIREALTALHFVAWAQCWLQAPGSVPAWR